MSSLVIDQSVIYSQERVLNILCGNDNVFLSGRAGTGKSYVVQQFIKREEMLKHNIAICAPTGIAALHIDGCTLHRFFKLPLDILLDIPTQKELSRIIELHSLDTLLIDEISMCRIDVFEYIMRLVELENINRIKQNRTIIKVVVVGDFFQLPPVVKGSDKALLTARFTDMKQGFAFESKYWDKMCFRTAMLTKVIRQSDSQTSFALNSLRVGDMRALDFFNTNCCKSVINNAIFLCGRNDEANKVNQFNYSRLYGTEEVYDIDIDGKVNDSELAVDKQLKLKQGARVLAVANQYSLNSDLLNGELGTVIKLSESSVVLRMDDGRQVTVEPYTWKIKSYKVEGGKLMKETIGSYTQLPLKLGYAITIHKSQGQTYESANINPDCWDYGQLYVALSRTQSISHTYLTQKIQEKFLKSSLEVYDFYSKLCCVD